MAAAVEHERYGGPGRLRLLDFGVVKRVRGGGAALGSGPVVRASELQTPRLPRRAYVTYLWAAAMLRTM